MWEALATDEGRDRWLEPDPARKIRIEAVEEPHRLVWWWWSDDAPPRRVEFLIVAAPAGSRVVVVESAPSFPLELLASRHVADARPNLSDALGLVFGALADPTRRLMVERLLRDGSTSVPSLSSELRSVVRRSPSISRRWIRQAWSSGYPALGVRSDTSCEQRRWRPLRPGSSQLNRRGRSVWIGCGGRSNRRPTAIACNNSAACRTCPYDRSATVGSPRQSSDSGATTSAGGSTFRARWRCSTPPSPRDSTFLDTANSYGKGQSEEFIGEWLPSRRDQVVIATKFGSPNSPDDYQGARGSADYIPRAVEASLRRLRTDTIDLYWYHRPDGVTPIAETLEALDALVGAGTVRAIGASNFSTAQIEEADRVAAEHGLHAVPARSRMSTAC